jgi:4-amino-4-deoxy-L-arabinose transferase-like glycosyltransferase
VAQVKKPDTSSLSERRFYELLAALGAGGLLLRVLYVLLVTRHEDTKVYDAFYYQLQGLALAQGHFFPAFLAQGPDAAHPPLTSIALVPASYLFGLRPGETPQRLTMALLGAVVVVLVGLLARRLHGGRVGLVAAAFAALYPNMWMPSGIVMSETLVMLLMALLLWALYELLSKPSRSLAIAVGILCGLEILTRAELVLLVPMLLVPAVLLAKQASRHQKTRLLVVSLLACTAVVGPWVGRNLVSFEDTTVLSTGEGPVLLGANCHDTYYGAYTGSWSLGCSTSVRKASDQSVESTLQFDAGKRYLLHHLSRLPLVALARAGRVWDVYEPLQMADGDVNEGLPVPASIAGLFAYYLFVPLSLAGLVALRKQGLPLWPLLVPALSATLVAITGYGQVRFRAEFEVPLVVLAAVGLDRVASVEWARWKGGRAPMAIRRLRP